MTADRPPLGSAGLDWADIRPKSLAKGVGWRSKYRCKPLNTVFSRHKRQNPG